MPENLDDLTCNYYLPNDFAMTNCNTDNKNLSILNLNIRSIANKFNTFRNLLSTLKKPFSIISLLTETWLNDQNSEISILLILILFALCKQN
jgi:hypothetical protein